ncbi:hypothetical protein [Thermoflavimicrobium daqui]|uniref:Uncharacterized protein n=1 Tax=Thermoflavimicrobium daqui TaxID=2137476 RepID=A0A364K3S0_9BACL|nr:hypothetical protein [Thermoflavimicrobium daqui]RAL24020.1 hypothetical protein DL897_09955 [Thermoflavimicrobium daqui]
MKIWATVILCISIACLVMGKVELGNRDGNHEDKIIEDKRSQLEKEKKAKLGMMLFGTGIVLFIFALFIYSS